MNIKPSCRAKRSVACAIAVLLYVLILGSCNTRQQQFDLTGALPVKDGTVITLMQDPFGGMKVLAEDTARGGRFHFQCPVKEIMPVSVVYHEGKMRYSYPVILEKADVKFRLRNAGQAVVSGGKYNARLFAYQHDTAYLRADENLFKERQAAAGQTDTGSQWRSVQYFMKKNKIRSDYLLKIMNDKQAPRMAVIAALLLQLQPDRQKAMAVVNEWAPEIGDSSFVVRQARKMNEEQEKLINSRKGRMVGVRFVDFTVPDVQGDSLHLASVVAAHAYTLLQFWASWCVPCRAEVPELKKIYRSLRDKGLAIVSFSMDNDRTSWMKATEKDGLGWPSVSDLLAQQSPVIKQYGVSTIPANVIIDRNGTVVASNLVGDELKAKLEALFK